MQTKTGLHISSETVASTNAARSAAKAIITDFLFFCKQLICRNPGPESQLLHVKLVNNVRKNHCKIIWSHFHPFLPDSQPDTPVLLSVDETAAKIVNTYFYEMSDQKYEQFAIKDGEVRKYFI